MTPDHEDLQSLLGAYALHAVEPDDASRLEEHLAVCPRCRAELAGYLRTAPLLGSTHEEPPSGLWEDIVSTIGDRRAASLPPQVRRAVSPRRRRGSRMPLLAALAAAVIVLAAATGALWSGLVGQPGGSPAARLGEAATAAGSGRHLTVDLTGPGGRRAAKVIIAAGDRAFLVPEALPSLPPGRTYQLWASVRGAPVSLGLVGSPAEIVEFDAQPVMAAFMITAEPSGGVAQPDSPVLAIGRASAAEWRGL